MGGAGLLALSLALATPMLHGATPILPGASPTQNGPSHQLEHALLLVSLHVHHHPLILTWASTNCYKCQPQTLAEFVTPVTKIPEVATSKYRFTIDSTHPGTLGLTPGSPGGLKESHHSICTVDVWFGELGEYSFVITENITGNISCGSITMTQAPIVSYLPVLVSIIIVLLLPLLHKLFLLTYRMNCVQSLLDSVSGHRDDQRLLSNDLGCPTHPLLTPSPSTTVHRLRSLDTFRGISIVLMVFVNYGGGKYWFFKHTSWNGLTLADVVFPWFVFAMGAAVGISSRAALSHGDPRSSLCLRAARRGLIMILLGVLVVTPNYRHGALDWSRLRLPGVLQRLGLAYIAMALCQIVSLRPTETSRWPAFRDLTPYWGQWLVMTLIGVTWVAVSFFLPVPGCQTGYLGPGGIGDGGSQRNCTGGAAGYIDRMVLTERHLYQTPTPRVVYKTTMPYDPEGILGTLNTILMAFLGLQAARTLLSFEGSPSSIQRRFLVWATLLGLMTAVLTKCSRDEGFIPINKNLWSTSFVTVTASLAFLLLFLLHLLTDSFRVWSGTPFHYPGMNSLLVYIGHEILEPFFPFSWGWSTLSEPLPPRFAHPWFLAQNLLAAGTWVLISYRLHRSRIYLKI